MQKIKYPKDRLITSDNSYTDTNEYESNILDDLKSRDGRPSECDNEDGILKAEVERAIKRLRNNKTCGIGGIPAEQIKAGGPRIIEEVWKICKKIWETGKWPKNGANPS